MADNTNTAGLAGVTAGKTAICTVGKKGVGLTYRGYLIEDLAEKAEFEEVAHLMLYGALPTADELASYRKRLIGMRGLPEGVKTALEVLPRDTHPMDVLRTGASVLGTLEPETDADAQQHEVADRLLASFPSMLMYWYHFAHNGERIDVETDDATVGGHFLHLLHREAPSDDAVACMATSLILYAEHEFNASTFTARVITATLSDFYSATVGAIGALRGPLHGGANEKAMALIESFDDPDAAEAGLKQMLADKEKIMGFGHRVYKNYDPRARIMQKTTHEVLAELGIRDDPLLDVAMELEKIALSDEYFVEKKLYPNIDFYSGITLRALGFPTTMFTVLFALARTVGWIAQWKEMVEDPSQKIGRPRQLYTGSGPRDYTPIAQRR